MGDYFEKLVEMARESAAKAATNTPSQTTSRSRSRRKLERSCVAPSTMRRTAWSGRRSRARSFSFLPC